MENKKEYDQKAYSKNPQQPQAQKHFHQANQPSHLLQCGLNIPPDHRKPQQANFHMHSFPQQFQNQQVHRHQQLQPQQIRNAQNQLYNEHPHPDFNSKQLLLKITKPPPLSVCSNNIPQSPQIWVPHQKPVHYNHQPQNRSEGSKESSQASPQNKFSSKDTSEKKKVNNSNTSQLKPPTAKRPPDAPVTKQGWLHKQGSDGLMLWKKRWFVLSEYCLFYYKGPEEEKLLGSILLPSYKVSVCGPEDKVNRKYAFKCEHVNMRTYILAADSLELMMMWVHVLNLASLLQVNNDSNQVSDSSAPSSHNTSTKSHKQQVLSQSYSSPGTHTHSSSNTTEMSSQSQQESCHYKQPLYANAPPKPRRLNDGSYSSPSPDVLDRSPNPDSHLYIHHMQRPVPDYPVDVHRTCISPHFSQTRYKIPQCQYPYRGNTQNVTNNVERRTPDTYGRSNLNMAKISQTPDYEDIYAEYPVYKRPLSPVSHCHLERTAPNLNLNPLKITYPSVSMQGPKNIPHYQQPDLRKSQATMARPHSADFLEYEMNRQQHFNCKQQQPRPKSSLDINRNINDNDNYFYSEECYAEKMRKSVQYLHTVPKYAAVHSKRLVRHPSPASPYIHDENAYHSRLNTQTPILRDQSFNELHRNTHPVRSKSVLSDASMSKDLERDTRLKFDGRIEREAISPTSMHSQSMYSVGRDRQYTREQSEKFTRSASARLAHNAFHMERMHEDRSCGREGDRKREESMKRLLEWKQRMLQSPLNRKMQDNRAYMIREYKDYHNKLPSKVNIRPRPITRRSMNNLQSSSYSSDDEENEDRSKESIHPQAGRTLDTFPITFEPFTPAQSTSVTQEFVKPLTPPSVMHENTESLKLCMQQDKSGGPCMSPCEPNLKEETHLTTTPLPSSNSEFSDIFDENTTTSDIRKNGALIKSILAEFENKIDTKEKFDDQSSKEDNLESDTTIMEENYLPMSPSKNILESKESLRDSIVSLEASNDTGENPYVEMNQSMDLAILANNSSVIDQPYEILCFKGGKMEPIYMELKNPDKFGVTFKGNTRLPDVIMSQKSENKSDSSDADDEASKDLDSLDAPSHPRFSLSDTFRPASYYIGTSQVAPELQDSSDSELVSPPPIPTSPPPLEDLDAADDCLSTTQEIRPTEQTLRNVSYNSLLLSTSNSHEKISRGSNNSLNSRLSFNPRSSETASLNSSILGMNRTYSNISFHNDKNDTEKSSKSIGETISKPKSLSENDYVSSIHDSLNLDKDMTESQSIESEIHVEDRFNYENFCIIKPTSSESTAEIRHILKDQDGKKSYKSEDLNMNDMKSNADSPIIPNVTEFEELKCSTSSVKIDCDINIEEMNQFASYMSHDASFKQSAPYYYSDLPVSTTHMDNPQINFLNNQRRTMNESKKDITHIVNPIKCNSQYRNFISSPHSKMMDDTFKLAVEARSASMDFLNLTDKSGHIDEKNIYESDTLKKMKTSGMQQSYKPITENGKNVFPAHNKDKFLGTTKSEDANLRRSHSSDNFLENVLNSEKEIENRGDHTDMIGATVEVCENSNIVSEGSYLWEEDAIWRERLRSVSQRHTKSVDDLVSLGESAEKFSKKPARGINRDVLYVNGNVLKPSQSITKTGEAENADDEDKTRMKRESSFILDREKLRQWDLLSSAPSDDQLSVVTGSQTPRGNSIVLESSEGNIIPENIHLPDAASGSLIVVNTKDNLSKNASEKKTWNMNNQPGHFYPSCSGGNQFQDENFAHPHQPSYHVPNLRQHNRSDIYSENNRKESWPEKMNMSAGELLGRTHEELVLLLIQLRRQSTSILQSIDSSYSEIDKIQATIHLMDQAKKLENLQKLEQIKQHLIELEKQYEKGKPLLNLVDNMVKLGSLYRTPNDKSERNTLIRDRLEFNQQVQERRLLAEERRDWNRLHTDNLQLQEKVQQLYQLDRLIQEESGTLQCLQQDKEEIERALGGLKLRLTKGFSDPSETEMAIKQQLMLENELSRVHLMLAQNSKQLEETVAGNARLEQELLILKQKLQTSRHLRNSPQFSSAGDSLPCVIGTSAMLESDLQKVQQKVGDLQKQREELSIQVRQLTDRSNNLQKQIKPSNLAHNNQNLTSKKKVNLLWRETDLDTMSVVDHGDSWEDSSRISGLCSPIADSKLNESGGYIDPKSVETTNDDLSQNFNPHEKQEIKTVRIVKRESERRQRDREKTTVPGKWDSLIEEDDSSQNSSILFRPAPVQKTISTASVHSPNYDSEKTSSGILSRDSSLSSPSLPLICSSQMTSSTEHISEKSSELSPVFKSEAARQIITEMSSQDTSSKQTNRRAVPKEKRRHFTAPHNNLIAKSFNSLPLDSSGFDKGAINERRARDDLDMERALKQRIDTPDVVRSTLSKKELKYNENTIDNILGTPNKITIPERYIPEQLPQLSVEEQEYRLRKVESIKKMLSDTAIISGSTVPGEKTDQTTSNNTGSRATVAMIEEKKQREHLLQLNQLLAKQVMEMSKIVAVNALANLPLQPYQMSNEEDDASPVTPLPIYQQRENFYS